MNNVFLKSMMNELDRQGEMDKVAGGKLKMLAKALGVGGIGALLGLPAVALAKDRMGKDDEDMGDEEGAKRDNGEVVLQDLDLTDRPEAITGGPYTPTQDLDFGGDPDAIKGDNYEASLRKELKALLGDDYTEADAENF